MNKQQGLAIVDGLRRAQAAGAPVVELKGKDARNFAFVKDEASRKKLLGSFRIEADKTFFVSVVSSPKNDDDYGFAVFERVGGNLLLGSNLVDPVGVVWRYQPSKQHGSNQARKEGVLRGGEVRLDHDSIPWRRHQRVQRRRDACDRSAPPCRRGGRHRRGRRRGSER